MDACACVPRARGASRGSSRDASWGARNARGGLLQAGQEAGGGGPGVYGHSIIKSYAHVVKPSDRSLPQFICTLIQDSQEELARLTGQGPSTHPPPTHKLHPFPLGRAHICNALRKPARMLAHIVAARLALIGPGSCVFLHAPSPSQDLGAVITITSDSFAWARKVADVRMASKDMAWSNGLNINHKPAVNLPSPLLHQILLQGPPGCRPKLPAYPIIFCVSCE